MGPCARMCYYYLALFILLATECIVYIAHISINTFALNGQAAVHVRLMSS